MDKRILFHMCCAPCSYKPTDLLLEEGYEVTGFFYNPNIHPYKEFKRRKENLQKLGTAKMLDIIYINEVNQSKWEGFCGTIEERCVMCYRVRLEKTAIMAKENQFNCFSTSLLISPYQNHEKLIEIAKEYEKKYGVSFLYKDFRNYFRESYNSARKNGIYTQKYCGCIKSLEESPFKNKIKWA